MKHLNLRWIIIALIGSIFLIIFFQGYLYNKITVVTFINALFLSGLTLIILGGAMFVYQGGFFKGIIYSFKRFFKSFSLKNKWIVENEFDDKDDDEILTREYKISSATLSVLLVGILLFVISVLLAFL